MASFSLDLWQTLTAQGQHYFAQKDMHQAHIFYALALDEAQKLIDDTQLSKDYEHSAQLYMTACHHLVTSAKGQGLQQEQEKYLQLAHTQLQVFANRPELTELTRVNSLKVLDVTLVGLLDYYQTQAVQHGQILADALIDEHVAYMAQHDDKNLSDTPCNQCSDCVYQQDDATIH